MLARFDERAPIYDRENRFFDEDFAELERRASSTSPSRPSSAAAAPASTSTRQLLRRLGYHAPATALAVNMHVYWTGVAADLLRAGDDSCRFVLDKAAAGEVLCALHGEAGNDMPLLLSTLGRRASTAAGGSAGTRSSAA